MAEDRVVLEERHVRVTSTTVRIGPTTYPLSGITSVRSLHKASMAPLLLGVAGLIALVFALLALNAGLGGERVYRELVEAAIMAGPLGLVLIGAAVLAQRSNRGSRVLILGTAGGERRPLPSGDAAFVERVRMAIEQALAQRG